MRRSTVLVFIALSASTSARADAPPSPSAVSKAADLPLADLPSMPPVTLPTPKATAVQALETRVDQLLNQRATHPFDPKVEFSPLVGDLDEDIVPAIAQRLEQVRRSIDGPAALTVLDRARKEGSKALVARKKGSGKSEKSARHNDGDELEGDWLQFALFVGKPDSAAWRDLVQVYGMLRMLEAVGTTSGVREMLNAYSYFGELVRIDLQRAIERLGDKAVPALIEAREHDARRVRDWARRELDILGRAIPGEAVSTKDPTALADVLLAFGRVRDVDAARVVLSFVASEQAHLRRAARQAIVAIGEPAVWHLRDAYESATGDKPSRSWDHRRLAQELFRLHDRAGMTAVNELMAKGTALADQGNARAAAEQFDQVLARAPLFERRREMAPTFEGVATELVKEAKHPEALAALRKALRLDPEGANVVALQSRIATLEGRLLLERGTPDPFILKRAIELDSTNREARELLASLETRSVEVESHTKRNLAGLAATVAALLSMVWLARRRELLPIDTAAPRDIAENVAEEAREDAKDGVRQIPPAQPETERSLDGVAQPGPESTMESDTSEDAEPTSCG